jgi:integrase
MKRHPPDEADGCQEHQPSLDPGGDAMTHPNRKPPRLKPEKPRADFPLFPHQTGRWAKKVKGTLRYFGPWEDPDGALKRWLEQKDDLLAGRVPRKAGVGGVTVAELCGDLLDAKLRLVQSGELAERTFGEYKAVTDIIVEVFGKNRLVSDLRSDDFDKLRAHLSRTSGPVRLGGEVGRVRTVFKFAVDTDLIDRPVKFGPAFKRPSRRVLRLARKANGPRMLEADELRRVLDKAPQPLRAMVLLGANCGLGASDVGRLRLSHLDLDSGWLDFPRPKTGIDRRCPLWAETVEAVKDAIANRPTPKDPDDADLVFLTKQGNPWVRMTASTTDDKENFVPGIPLDALAQRFAKLLDDEGLKRPGLGFYALRRGLETVGGEAKDLVALDAIMGHARDDMASLYRERISDDRLRAVVEHVHGWLFGKGKKR